MFSVEERVKILTKATKDIPNVEVKAFEGLSVNFARENHAQVIVRGLRAVTDFEYELQMAQTNRVLAPDVDTVFSYNQSGICILKLHDYEKKLLISEEI